MMAVSVSVPILQPHAAMLNHVVDIQNYPSQEFCASLRSAL